ncbi:MAG: hypothetical protein ACM3Q4_07445 [Acidobacteriota bacterium]
MKLRHILALGMLVSVGMSAVSLAQEKKEPPQRDVKVVPSTAQPTPEEEQAPLPKIENPEFVITGHETMELPEAAKSATDDARSFVPPLPSAGQKTSDLSRTATKQSIGSSRSNGMNGKVYGSFGNFVTPQLGAWFGQSYDQGSVAVNGRYASSDGYMTNTNWLSAGFGVAGSYKLGKWENILSESRWKGELAAGTDEYRAYGSAHPRQKRTHNDLDAAIGADSRFATGLPDLAPVDGAMRLAWNRTSLSDTSSAVENDIGILASGTTLYASVPVDLAMEYRITGESMPRADVQTMQWLSLSGSGKIAALENLQFTLGASFTFYRGNTGASSLRLYPALGVRWFPARWAGLHAAFQPSVTRQTLRQLLRTNRYVLTGSAILPTDAPAAFSAGIDLAPIERAALSVTVDYRALNNFQSFLESDSSHIWSPVYLSDIRSVKTDVRIRYALTPLDAATGFVTVNSVKHKDSTSMLPYIPEMTAGILYRHWFQSDISAEISAEYTGRRFTDFQARHANAAYALIGMKAEYGIARNLRLTAEVQNLFDQKYYIWNGYRERPFFVSFGINYLW